MIESLLTLNPIKRVVYQRDAAFNQAIDVFLNMRSESESLISFLWNHTGVLLRPEAIVARRSRSVFPMLRAHGLIPVSARRIHLTPEQGSLMWRYQANVMTRRHYSLLQRLMSAGPSIYVILKDYSQRRRTPAAVHVTYLKGPTLKVKRQPLHLRSLAGPPIANMLSYIHASDDPADFLREMALLLPRFGFVDVLRAAAAGEDRTSEVLGLIAEAEAYAPKGVIPASHEGYGRGHDSFISSAESTLRKEWITIINSARTTSSYVTGESYDAQAAVVPDSKQYLAPLDNNLIFADIGPGF